MKYLKNGNKCQQQCTCSAHTTALKWFGNVNLSPLHKSNQPHTSKELTPWLCSHSTHFSVLIEKSLLPEVYIQHLVATCTMTPSWSKLQRGFFFAATLGYSTLNKLQEVKDIVDSQVVPDYIHVRCIFLWNEKVYCISLDPASSLHAKGTRLTWTSVVLTVSWWCWNRTNFI